MELLVRVVDKVNENAELNAQCSKRGDIIAAVEDGHKWTEKEKNNADWVIIKQPGVPLTTVSARPKRAGTQRHTFDLS